MSRTNIKQCKSMDPIWPHDKRRYQMASGHEGRHMGGGVSWPNADNKRESKKPKRSARK